MSTTSTYMGFPISTIAVDSGLNWETNLNAALTVIDQHNHSPGFGQQIQPNGLNINSDLTFQSNNATNLRAARFTPQLSPIANSGSDVGEIYVSGNELYYNDVTGGNQVQITSNGTVNATSSGISSGTASASFSAGVLLVKSSSTSYANIAMQSAILANSGNLTNQLTLQAPTLSSSYSITLPSIPASTSFVTIDTSGNLSGSIPTSAGLTTSNLSASAGILGTQLSASANILGSQLDAAAGITPGQTDSLNTGYYDDSGSVTTFTTTTSGTVVTSGTPTAFTTTKPVFISFSGGQIQLSQANGGSNTTASFAIVRKGPLTNTTVCSYDMEYFVNGSSHAGQLAIPASSLNTIDLFPDSAREQYRLVASVSNGTLTITNMTMQVVQV